MTGGGTSFHGDSDPYLVPTEHPWRALADRDLTGKRVLTVAGSGDGPVFWNARGVEAVVAVDVSRKACFLTELKRAAYGMLHRQEFACLFFSGLEEVEPADAQIEGSGRDPKACYQKVRSLLTGPARAFFDPLFDGAPEGSTPLTRFLRPTDRIHVALFPPLTSQAAYRAWAAGAARPVSIVCAPVERFLEETAASFHLIYLSNILEYVRRDFLLAEDDGGFRRFLERFWTRVDRALEPAGAVGVYIFQGQDTHAFSHAMEDLAIPLHMGYKAEFIPVTIRPPGLDKAVWRHTLVFLVKPASRKSLGEA
ncbi:hypothetical protein [Desulfacinum hydrothermale]|nr:hypothetical protein [Desulfacinum hydrothermale]